MRSPTNTSMARSEHLPPAVDPPLEADDGHQAVDAHFEVVAAPGKVVDHSDPVPSAGQIQRSRPTQIAVAAQDQNVHVLSPSRFGGAAGQLRSRSLSQRKT